MKRGGQGRHESVCRDALADFLQERATQHKMVYIMLIIYNYIIISKRILLACLREIYFPERKQNKIQPYLKSHSTTTRSGL